MTRRAYGGGIRHRLLRGTQIYFAGQSQSQSYATTDSQSASLSWNKAPIWGLRPDPYYCMTFASSPSL
jgi:hypothetical protein